MRETRENWLDLQWEDRKRKEHMGKISLSDWQLEQIGRTVGLAMENSTFYRELYGGSPAEEIRKGPRAAAPSAVECKTESLEKTEKQTPAEALSWKDFEKLPFTSARDLRSRGMEMVCVPLNRISRVVTLPELVLPKLDLEIQNDCVSTGSDTGKEDCRKTPFSSRKARTSAEPVDGNPVPDEKSEMHERSDRKKEEPSVISFEDVLVSTSGTTGRPKRVFYTEEDQQLTADYFSWGMRYMVSEGDRCGILMPGSTPGSVGDLLARGLAVIGVEAVFEYEPGLDCLVGEPRQVLNLVRELSRTKASADSHCTCKYRFYGGRFSSGIYPRKILLSADYVDPAVRNEIEELTGALVYEHYGMTEMGLGCAVSCHVREGYHVREYDLYVELINPETGEVIPRPGEGSFRESRSMVRLCGSEDRKVTAQMVSDEEGNGPVQADSEAEREEALTASQYGEIVFTTLNREGMPFIRYRTGDMSRWLPPCSCGSLMARLDRVMPRVYDEYIKVKDINFNIQDADNETEI